MLRRAAALFALSAPLLALEAASVVGHDEAHVPLVHLQRQPRKAPVAERGVERVLRHIDKATGVPDWWEPFSETWTFHFPSKPAE